MKTPLIKKIHLANVGLVFVVFFLIFYLPTILFIQFKKTKPLGHFMNKCVSFFSFMFFPVFLTRDFRFKPKKNETYIFCCNHTSFLDIPMLFLSVPGYLNIIGKASIGRWPLFGYMYRNLYICVDRKSKKSRYQSLIDSKASLREGRNLVLFPEGTIPNEGAPNMIPFKDGAFRLAIEEQIPIIPVTIPHNWILLPDKGQKGFTLMKSRIIIHEPINTKGLQEKDLESLKEQTFSIIDSEIKRWNK